MSRVARFSPAALAAVLILAGCGGGGGSSPVQKPAAHPSAAPASTRTVVGTTTLSLVLPKVLHAKGTLAVAKKTAAAKRPQFVDPQPAPTSGSATSNLIDIYVDGSLLYNLDGQAGSYGASVFVNATATGAQTLQIPLFSTATNEIVAVEYDDLHANLIAIGETNLSTFTPGTAQNISITMQMNAVGLAIIDQPNESDPVMMAAQNGPWGLTENVCSYGSGGTSGIGVYDVDAYNNLVPAANGYGGTGFATVTGLSDNSGTTSLSAPQTQFPGTYTILWDSNCDTITLNATSPNPANSINADISNSTAYANYLNGYINNAIAGPNQGIWNLYYEYDPQNSFSNQYFSQTLNQASNATVGGTIDASNTYQGS